MACNSGTTLSTVNRKRHQPYSTTNRNCQPATRCKEYICFRNVQPIIISVPLSSTIIIRSAARNDISISFNRRRNVAEFAVNFAKDTIATHNSRIFCRLIDASRLFLRIKLTNSTIKVKVLTTTHESTLQNVSFNFRTATELGGYGSLSYAISSFRGGVMVPGDRALCTKMRLNFKPR